MMMEFKTYQNVGLYPIVDSVLWLKKLLPFRLQTIQLRIKDPLVAKTEIPKAIALAHHYDTCLFINDHWQLALEYQAAGIHIGPEDLPKVDLELIKYHGLYLGLSCYLEADFKLALDIKPSYVAFGPIYPTDSKQFSFEAQGLERLTYWRNACTLPLVAIGGITLENIDDVLSTGVDGVAIISAITQAKAFAAATQALLNRVQKIL